MRESVVNGQTIAWEERLLVIRSHSYTKTMQKGLHHRLDKAEAALNNLTPARSRGKQQIEDEQSLLDAIEKKVPRQQTLRFVGGGAQSEQWAQILADVTGREIEVIASPQNVGALGAAITCAIGLGITDFDHAKAMIKVAKRFSPLPENRGVYERQFSIFKRLYHQNRKLYKELNG
jgi:sugar (pentulose or hexulose) kinase